METIVATVIATLFTMVALILPFVMTTNTDASMTARWAVFLWLATVAVVFWVLALNSVGAITW